MAELLNVSEIEKRLTILNRNTELSWKVSEGKLQKVFVFTDFVAAFGFMTKAAIIAQSMDHHPEWCNVYNKVTVNLTTHSAGGITELDFNLVTAMENCI